MAKCLVCGRETVCAVCDGEGDGWDTGDGAIFDGTPADCQRCGGSGLSHTHPRKERKRARRAAVKKAADDREVERLISAGELVRLRVRVGSRWASLVTTPSRVTYDDTGAMCIRIGLQYHRAEFGGPVMSR